MDVIEDCERCNGVGCRRCEKTGVVSRVHRIDPEPAALILDPGRRELTEAEHRARTWEQGHTLGCQGTRRAIAAWLRATGRGDIADEIDEGAFLGHMRVVAGTARERRRRG